MGVSSKLGYHRLTVYINSANTLQFLSHDQQETMVARVTQTTNTTTELKYILFPDFLLFAGCLDPGGLSLSSGG